MFYLALCVQLLTQYLPLSRWSMDGGMDNWINEGKQLFCTERFILQFTDGYDFERFREFQRNGSLQTHFQKINLAQNSTKISNEPFNTSATENSFNLKHSEFSTTLISKVSQKAHVACDHFVFRFTRRFVLSPYSFPSGNGMRHICYLDSSQRIGNV